MLRRFGLKTQDHAPYIRNLLLAFTFILIFSHTPFLYSYSYYPYLARHASECRNINFEKSFIIFYSPKSRSR